MEEGEEIKKLWWLGEGMSGGGSSR